MSWGIGALGHHSDLHSYIPETCAGGGEEIRGRDVLGLGWLEDDN